MRQWILALAQKNLLRTQHDDVGLLVARKAGTIWRRAVITEAGWRPMKKTLAGFEPEGEPSIAYFELCRYLGLEMSVAASVV